MPEAIEPYPYLIGRLEGDGTVVDIGPCRRCEVCEGTGLRFLDDMPINDCPLCGGTGYRRAPMRPSA